MQSTAAVYKGVRIKSEQLIYIPKIKIHIMVNLNEILHLAVFDCGPLGAHGTAITSKNAAGFVVLIELV